MTCEHELVIPFEPPARNGPVVVRWRCDECWTEFVPKTVAPSRIRVWLETRRLRRDMKGWRNG